MPRPAIAGLDTMETARAILRRSGYESTDEMPPNERCTVSLEADGRGDLVLEKVGPARLRVAERTVSTDAAAPDIEVVFRTESDRWVPIEYTRPPAIHRYDATGLDVGDALRRWNETLRRRGVGAVDRKPEHL